MPRNRWKHCKGQINPADLPSRGTTLRDLKSNEIWFHGPKWIADILALPDLNTSVPPECLVELRAKDKSSLAMSVIKKTGVGSIIDHK